MTLRSLVVPLALLLAGACASAPPSAPFGGGPQRRDPDRLSQTEILDSHLTDAYQAVRNLRPNWLRRRGQVSLAQPADVVTYIDNVQLGGPDMLRTIPTSTVMSIHFLDAASATQRWGLNHVHGAILVVTLH